MKEFEMSLIDRYIAEVGRHLPEKDRSDIENEIRTMVDDMIDERGPSAAKSETIVAETLEQSVTRTCWRQNMHLQSVI
jgi:hypothetical protein